VSAIERLRDLVRRGYGTGLRPASGTYCDSTGCCGMTAAYVAAVGHLPALPDSLDDSEFAYEKRLSEWALDNLGLTYSQYLSFVVGFDGRTHKAVSEENRPFWELGREMRNEFLKQGDAP